MGDDNSGDTLFQRILSVAQDAILPSSDPRPEPPTQYAFLRRDDRDERFGRQVDILSSLSNDEEAQRAEAVCKYLCAALEPVADHVARLDDAFSEMLEFSIINPVDSAPNIAKSAHDLLLRLPPSPVSVLANVDDLCELPGEYFHCPSADRILSGLKVATFIPRNLIATAVHATLRFFDRRNPRLAIKPYLDMIMELLEAVLRLRARKHSPLAMKVKLLVLFQFLWKLWHETLCIHRWGQLGAYLHHGAALTQSNFLDIRGYDFLHSLTVPNSWTSQVPPSMCRWAFELLKSDRANTQANFGTFLEAFAQTFGDLSPRCVKQHDGAFSQCDGSSPSSCMRFTGAKIEDQSAHLKDCDGACRRLYWDEKSYRDVTGTRAVKMDVYAEKLTYCASSNLTMAVSHVWSHGQGGRIDGGTCTGFNTCLHQRYCAIAQSFGCDSYWMDTPCIPEDHALRREAIEGINPVFSESKITLVCDRDLMMVDVQRHDVAAYERLLATLLVCDWSARAWTFLEAVKGANNLCILCRNDEVVRLTDALRSVHEAGNLSLINLCLAASHLLRKNRIDYNGSLEATGTMLSHRHASRPGDEIVIWSLLVRTGFYDMPLCTTAEQFWSSRNQVNTAFLVSDVPRMTAKGFSWAPSRPDFPIDFRLDDQARAFAHEGDGSALAAIFPRGQAEDDFVRIQATWLTCNLDDLDIGRSMRSIISAWLTGMKYVLNVPRLRQIVVQRSRSYLRSLEAEFDYYYDMCLISSRTRGELNRIVDSVSGPGVSVALLRPMQRKVAIDVPYDHRGFPGEIPVVVVTSVDGEVWTWEQVIRWDQSVALPPFRRQTIDIE